MQFQIITEKGSWQFEADEILNVENVVIGTKNGKYVAIISKDNIFAVIPSAE